ncbi:peptide methionine sulfoxide reductase MsrA [Glycocaulis alkaliphilus]|uniref:Peptide methionine sulfoxide reductase MsrA n=1 Tax=Glycocaulis alkaliphilus TaxID=1434191 RepID=A0A3T0ECE6_9PROT|nr:peptide-methionine (S)-S-oxide reductase MsrA [Glycocaulis alkaliphilus]AZU04970.1 peptide methionine sulfoxide reductase MsrA [Glycocaulis alkaliphilus]GGB66298.1 peptide methionine sulfoxide reductase MsrA [Glycocaulis alkaliphilus]
MRLLALIAAAFLMACSDSSAGTAQEAGEPAALPDGQARAILASGCFWCTEADFERLDGVIDVVSGFTGGHVENPEYRQVVNGNTGHVEAVEIIYDPQIVSYEALLHHYWRNVDPFDGGGQFCDRGAAYAPAIFTLDEAQRAAAEASAAEVEARFGQPLAVRIREAEIFWPAEDYHQNYAANNPIRYQRYRFGCRRDQRLREIWGNEAGGY